MVTIQSSVLVKTGYTAEELEAAVKAIRPDAGFNNYQAFVDAENEYGISSLYLISHACEESAWATSLIAPNNLFGFNANDANPAGDASSFASQAACIIYVANFLLVNYLTPGGRYYEGPSLHDIFINYSSSHDIEANTVASIMNLLTAKMPTQSTVKPEPNTQPTGSSTTYTVKEGDSLSSIASQHGTTLAELERLNPHAGHPAGNFGQIWAGDQIIISSTAPTPQSQEEFYTVVAGDTLSSIASKHGIDLSTIERLNPHAGHPAGNFDVLWVNDRLVIK